jgi:hypothetical protein
MKELTAIIVMVFGLCLSAHADIWKWVDENGNVHYGDTPAHDYSNKAQLVKHTPDHRSTATSSDRRSDASRGNDVDPDESLPEQQAREEAQAYYCKQAKDIYRSYVGAPRLYRTRDDGQREYLSDEEMAATIASAEASVAEWCN